MAAAPASPVELMIGWKSYSTHTHMHTYTRDVTTTPHLLRCGRSGCSVTRPLGTPTGQVVYSRSSFTRCCGAARMWLQGDERWACLALTSMFGSVSRLLSPCSWSSSGNSSCNVAQDSSGYNARSKVQGRRTVAHACADGGEWTRTSALRPGCTGCSALNCSRPLTLNRLAFLGDARSGSTCCGMPSATDSALRLDMSVPLPLR